MKVLIFFVAIILAAILFPIGFVWGTFEAFFTKGLIGGAKRICKYLYAIAFSIDQLGNVICVELFNDTLIKASSEFRFGNPDETISSVVGRNKQAGTLTKTGKILDKILDFLDENHSINAIGN